MRLLRLLPAVVLCLTISLPVRPQSCVLAEWAAKCLLGQCFGTSNEGEGCVAGGSGCSSCWRGFMEIPILNPSPTLAAQPDYFAGRLTEEGFVIDVPGSLEHWRVKAGDVAHFINGYRVTQARITRYTRERPIRSVRAMWDKDQRLHLYFRR